MTFFSFRQNNSGGSWNGPIVVCIEALTHAKALDEAAQIGLYFDGCDDGVDCPCCGDRWNTYAEEGPWPICYGVPLQLLPGDWEDTIPWRIHYADGRIETGQRVKKQEPNNWRTRQNVIRSFDYSRRLGTEMVVQGPRVALALSSAHGAS